ncbi:hypothetical protein GOBAR_AA35207 [Gossypium barbadense]|uniref:CRM domain-containing protein n=1 Tax=Gossypium barbadense TaxID=3634 RepID=A0A2P5W364_GOSBA|nr:hypothetical protein GOBAR_AA35207 [Gossypium barbadense]
MQKLLPRPLSNPSKHSFSYFFSHSVSKTTYDPPFSPISKPPKPKPKPPDLTPNRNPTPIKSCLPFDFKHSYSETDPTLEPIGFREPKRFSPFGPGRLDREWTGTSAPVRDEVASCLVEEERIRVLGDPLTEEEIEVLVEKYRHSACAQQINLEDSTLTLSPSSIIDWNEWEEGVTHNMLDDIRNHWKRAEAVRIKCLGVPTLDMDNVCFHLEPYAPIYAKLVKSVADGLTFEETKEMRNRGLHSPALMELTRNGVYVNVVARVQEAFETEEVIRLDCTHVGTSDCKRIGVKLRAKACWIGCLLTPLPGKAIVADENQCTSLFKQPYFHHLFALVHSSDCISDVSYGRLFVLYENLSGALFHL